MAGRKKAKLIDGFVTLRATQRHGLERRYATKPAETEEQPPPAHPEAASTAKSAPGGIGRTVMPTRYEIVCYSCGFQFVIRGKAASTQCPKCGARLGLNDETVSGPFSDELITAGKVTVTRSAVLTGGRIIANDILLEGTVKDGTIKAFKTLELGPGSMIAESSLDARSLRVAEGASYTFRHPRNLEDLEIAGKLNGDIVASGLVTLRARGEFSGRLKTLRLRVEEGGGLNADVEAAPDPTDGAEEAALESA